MYARASGPSLARPISFVTIHLALRPLRRADKRRYTTCTFANCIYIATPNLNTEVYSQCTFDLVAELTASRPVGSAAAP